MESDQRAVGGLWRRPDFLRLWTGGIISDFGSAITRIALPLTAVATLHATPEQMGYLSALGNLPILVFGLPAGVWVDRVRRRPILIGAELGRTLLLAAIPVAALLGMLHIAYLYLLSFLIGVLTLCFDLAYTSYIPTVVGRDDLVEGNAKLQMSNSIASIAGPSVAGLLIQIVSAPLAILGDACSFLISALCLASLHGIEPSIPSHIQRQSIGKDIREGLAFVWRQPVLRAMTLSSMLGSLGASMQQTVFVLFLSRELGWAPAQIGIIFSVAGGAALLGAASANQTARRLGSGRAVIGGTALATAGHWLIASTTGSAPQTLILLVAAQLLIGLGSPIYSINQLSLRQAITPDRLLGRVNASRRVAVFGMAPLGALLAGFIGQHIGLRPALATAALAMTFATLLALLSPLRSLQSAASHSVD